MAKETLRHKDVWNGEYKGVSYEIVKWWMGGLDIDDGRWAWNFYLIVPLAQVPDEQKDQFNVKPEPKDDKGRIHYKYSSGDLICELAWHYGITYYHKTNGVDDAPIVIKMGCDYTHYWDRGCEAGYSVESVEHDAKKCIDSLWAAVPDLNIRCGYNGQYYKCEEGSFRESGAWYSDEGFEASEKWRKEYKEEQSKLGKVIPI